jgi:hypothetical protein
MTQTFKILCRGNNQEAWTLYGIFTSEREFRAELPNIQACGLQIKRIGG